jgi:large subunit ribosomal protein L16
MKFKKYFKIKHKKNIYQYDKLYNGSIGLKALETCQLTGNQVTTTIKILKRSIKKKNFLINNVNPCVGVTRKPRDIRMGRGKGNFAFNIFHLKAGKILFELKGVSEKLSLRAFKLCANRLPIKTIIVKKNDQYTNNIKSN